MINVIMIKNRKKYFFSKILFLKKKFKCNTLLQDGAILCYSTWGQTIQVCKYTF